MLKKEHELLGLYKQVDEFYRVVTRDGDYNAVTILYQQIKQLRKRIGGIEMITYYFWLSCVSLTLNLILIHEIRKNI